MDAGKFQIRCWIHMPKSSENRMADQCVIPKYAEITLPDKHCVVQGRRKTVVAKRPLPYVFVVTHKAKQAGDNNIT